MGLSGGVDSSLTYSLTCEALGVENTIGVIMPYRTSKKNFKTNAEKLAQQKGGRTRYHEITGIPSLINTSFNMHEEPIVCSPHDAIRSFMQGNLDYLAIGPFLIKHPSE